MLKVLAGRLPKAFRKVQRFRKGVEPVVESPVFDPSHVHEELYKTRRANTPKEGGPRGHSDASLTG